MNPTIQIRPIEQKDNIDIAKVIRGALEEFGANKPGTVYFDPTTDALFELFNNTSGSYYYIATIDNNVVGGAGIFPTDNLPEGTCELVKLYLHKDASNFIPSGPSCSNSAIWGFIAGTKPLALSKSEKQNF